MPPAQRPVPVSYARMLIRAQRRFRARPAGAPAQSLPGPLAFPQGSNAPASQ